MKSLTIIIDIPDSKLSINSSAHWRTKHAPKTAAKEIGWVKAKEQMGKHPAFAPWGPFRIEVAWNARQENWIPDVDNLFSSLKPYIDGVASAGLFKNDKAMEVGRVLRGVDKEEPHVVIHFEKID